MSIPNASWWSRWRTTWPNCSTTSRWSTTWPIPTSGWCFFARPIIGGCCSPFRDVTTTRRTRAALEARLDLVADPGGRAWKVIDTSLYVVARRVAASMRQGRVLLAGDGAHQNSPLGGMGMNSGIHDAGVGRSTADLGVGWRGRGIAGRIRPASPRGGHRPRAGRQSRQLAGAPPNPTPPTSRAAGRTAGGGRRSREKTRGPHAPIRHGGRGMAASL